MTMDEAGGKSSDAISSGDYAMQRIFCFCYEAFYSGQVPRNLGNFYMRELGLERKVNRKSKPPCLL